MFCLSYSHSCKENKEDFGDFRIRGEKVKLEIYKGQSAVLLYIWLRCGNCFVVPALSLNVIKKNVRLRLFYNE